jgi:hypothetical protein
MSAHHYLKTETAYYQAVEKGIKKFEVRKNDRNYKSGDMIHLEETVVGVHTGRKLGPKEIVYILEGGNYGLEEGYCILGW